MHRINYIVVICLELQSCFRGILPVCIFTSSE